MHIGYAHFCYWITTNQIDPLVKKGSIKGIIFSQKQKKGG